MKKKEREAERGKEMEEREKGKDDGAGKTEGKPSRRRREERERDEERERRSGEEGRGCSHHRRHDFDASSIDVVPRRRPVAIASSLLENRERERKNDRKRRTKGYVRLVAAPPPLFKAEIGLDFTVVSFKEVVARSCDIPGNQQRLIYKGHILKNDKT
ncbi:hypothetical protein PIB30_050406, partial [Stylosanthes scabra]|nr:hypothetical protein [Stylosanthes scabra]